ncbi:hypothetical protein P355_0493 [Burkholderia cenocepacia KC-01]|nr:hypothetical protein P355_0493 [Burkholderia cenocepacia KC-01]
MSGCAGGRSPCRQRAARVRRHAPAGQGIGKVSNRWGGRS